MEAEEAEEEPNEEESFSMHVGGQERMDFVVSLWRPKRNSSGRVLAIVVRERGAEEEREVLEEDERGTRGRKRGWR